MEIREVTQYSDKAPFSGYGIWVIFELKYRKAQLIHPVTFTELILSEYEYVSSAGKRLWPVNETKGSFNKDKFLSDLKGRIKLFIALKKAFPINVVAKIIAELEGIAVEEALYYIKSLNKQVSAEIGEPTYITVDKESREFKLRPEADVSKVQGRPLTIVNALREIGQPANIYQITHLVNGKLKTKSDLHRVVTYFVNKLASQGILEIVS